MYSFDAPYDLEPTAFPESLRNYEETIDSHKNSTSADIDDEEDDFRHLELTFEEAEPGRHCRDRNTARNLRQRLVCFSVSTLCARLAFTIAHVSVSLPQISFGLSLAIVER